MAKRKTRLGALNRWWLRYEYKHTSLAVLGLVSFVFLLDSAVLSGVFTFLESLGYVGGLIAGALSASFFTAAPALVLIVELAHKMDPLSLAVIVGVGSAVGDMLLLLFFEERIFHELRPLFRRFGKTRRLTRRNRKSAGLLMLGILFITSPLPDEVGLGLLGISHFPKIVILVICLGLDTLGASLIILAARAIG